MNRRIWGSLEGSAFTWSNIFRLTGHFAFVAVLSLGAFLLLRAVCKDEVMETVVPDPPKEEEKPTGNAELDKMIADGQKAISEMKRLDDAIEDEKISQDIRRLEAVSRKIFDQVKADPSKLPQIRRFMDYYLPTTLNCRWASPPPWAGRGPRSPSPRPYTPPEAAGTRPGRAPPRRALRRALFTRRRRRAP